VTLPGSEGVHLRGFDKLKAIKPGQTKTATFQLRTKDLALWSVEKQTWYVPEGSIKLQVGASVTKLHLVSFLIV
jgi:beta-glucosidase